MLQTLSSHRSSQGPSRRAGAAMLLMVLLLIVLGAMVAFAVDVGLMAVLYAEVQDAVDSGGLAAALTLQQDSEDIQGAEEAAKRFIQLNRVGAAVTIPEGAIEVESGVFDDETNTFSATNLKPNAVRVFARQDDEPFFFGRLLGCGVFGAPASAVASSAPRPLDIMMVLDLSGSMADEGRIQALQNAAPTFVDVIENLQGDEKTDQIGVMGLAADPSKFTPSNSQGSGQLYDSGLHPSSDHYAGVLESTLSTNYNRLRKNVLSSRNLEAGKYDGWTGTGAAIGDAAHYLDNSAYARDNAEKVIVLMSDGYANRPSSDGPGYARTMAAYAARLDVKVFTISLGNDADLDLMKDIAQITDATHFDATGSGKATLTKRLTDAFEKVAAAIKRVQLVK